MQRILGYTRQAYWKFLPAPTRARARAAARSRCCETGLDRRADAEPEVGLVLGAARHRAAPSRRSTWLERVWRKTETVPGLTLAEPDYITLALELAVRERAGVAGDPRQQLARIENPDRKARFAFVRPALSADQARARRVLRAPEASRRSGSASRGCSKG